MSKKYSKSLEKTTEHEGENTSKDCTSCSDVVKSKSKNCSSKSKKTDEDSDALDDTLECFR